MTLDYCVEMIEAAHRCDVTWKSIEISGPDFSELWNEVKVKTPYYMGREFAPPSDEIDILGVKVRRNRSLREGVYLIERYVYGKGYC